MRSLVSLLLFFVVHNSLSQDLNYSTSTIPDELIKGANAVVRLDMMKVTISQIDQMKVQSKRIVTVLNDEGERFVSAYAPYDNETKITDLSAIVFDSQGNQIDKFKEKDFLDISASGSGTLYSDSRVKYLRYTPVSYPYTIVFERNYETSDTAFIPGWYFLDGYEVSTQKSNFSLDVLFNSPIRFKENNLELFTISSKITNNSFDFKAENLKAIKQEPFSPGFREIAPNIKFALEQFNLKGVSGKAKTWEELGTWIYNDLLTGRSDLDEAVKKKVRQLVAKTTDPKEKVEIIYQYLQDNTRYISVQLGIGGWQPITAREVDRVKYGDCKGLTNYTMALLKEVGIDSYYTVLYAGNDKKDLDPDFPALSGNHAFLNVPLDEEDLWLECTSQEVPLNFLGTFSDDRYVLRVTPKGGELVKSKQYTPLESRQLTRANIFIFDDERIDADITIESTGIQYDEKYTLPSKKEDEIEEHYKEYWSYVNNINIKEAKFEDNRETVQFSETIKASTNNYVSKAGDQLLFTPNMFNRNLYVPKRVRSRKNKVVVKRGYLDEDEFKINFPKNIKVEKLLTDVELKTNFGEYYLKMKRLSETQIEYKRKLIIYPGVFPKESYKDFREFRKNIARIDNSKIILIKT